jgi:very-short-patch-repair endonuclease
MARNIVVGQAVSETKKQLSKKLRQELTEEERILWNYLRRNQLNGLHFRRQQIIDGFVVDFYCHAAELVVEVDGSIHDERPDYDAERDKVMAARGLNVLRIRNEEVKHDLPGVLKKIATACGVT